MSGSISLELPSLESVPPPPTFWDRLTPLLGAVFHEIHGVLLLNSYGTVVLVIFSHINRFYDPNFYYTKAMHLFSQQNRCT
jgi:hypothetical protein